MWIRAVSRFAGLGVAVIVLGVACGTSERAASGPNGSWTSLTIAQGTVGSAAGLTIGVSSIQQDDTRPGLVGTFAMVAGEPRAEKTVSGHVGDTLGALGYVIFVAELSVPGPLGNGAPGPRGTARLLIRPASP